MKAKLKATFDADWKGLAIRWGKNFAIKCAVIGGAALVTAFVPGAGAVIVITLAAYTALAKVKELYDAYS